MSGFWLYHHFDKEITTQIVLHCLFCLVNSVNLLNWFFQSLVDTEGVYLKKDHSKSIL